MTIRGASMIARRGARGLWRSSRAPRCWPRRAAVDLDRAAEHLGPQLQPAVAAGTQPLADAQRRLRATRDLQPDDRAVHTVARDRTYVVAGSAAPSFALRPGVRWSDGAPFSADDVVYTFELLRKHAALDLGYVWGFVESVRALDPLTVEVTFQRPYIPGLADLAHQPIVPRHVWRDVADPLTFANPTPVGTGPFTEVLVFSDQVYELGRNPHYWQAGRPKVGSIRFLAYPSNDQANLALVEGDVDWAGNFVPAVDRTFVARDREHHHAWSPLVGNMVFLYANTKRPPLDDARVRKALSMAIDRERLVDVAMYGMTRPADATGLTDGYAAWQDEAAGRAAWMTHDPDARSALARRGRRAPAVVRHRGRQRLVRLGPRRAARRARSAGDRHRRQRARLRLRRVDEPTAGRQLLAVDRLLARRTDAVLVLPLDDGRQDRAADRQARAGQLAPLRRRDRRCAADRVRACVDDRRAARDRREARSVASPRSRRRSRCSRIRCGASSRRRASSASPMPTTRSRDCRRTPSPTRCSC